MSASFFEQVSRNFWVNNKKELSHALVQHVAIFLRLSKTKILLASFYTLINGTAETIVENKQISTPQLVEIFIWLIA